MILKAILWVQHFCSFATMFFIVNPLIKTDSTVIFVSCLRKHVCYEPLSLTYLPNLQFFNRLNFVYCLKFTSVRPDVSK